jgi:mannitol-1-/sugar-/sorbitol-6-phosphatase
MGGRGGENPVMATFLPARGLLVDMDGVLVESADAIRRHWRAWADRRAIPVESVMEHAHGSPSREVIARFVPAEEVAAEADWYEALAFEDPGDDVALPGAEEILSQDLLPLSVVTSATHAVARHRLERAGLGSPTIVVGADDVDRGKPDPAPYQVAAQRLGLAAQDCVAFEDSPVGARAATASGATTVGVLTLRTAEHFEGVATFATDLSHVRVRVDGVTVLSP